MATVHILLATHNGERFLAEQLESIRSQSLEDWTLLLMDDRSRDGSLGIGEEFAGRDARIRIVEKPAGAAPSALGTFGALARLSLAKGADYAFFCDQDDHWHPDKLARMLEALKSLEGPERTAALVHHDLAVVDETLQPLEPSFWSMMKIEPGSEAHAQRLLSRNEVTGCALACNRALLELALPIPDEAIMHDWWLALGAAYFGRLRALPETLVRYRQHGGNVLGARGFWHGLNPFTSWRAGWRRGNEEFLDTVRQARAFHARMADRLDAADPKTRALDLYRQIPSLKRGERFGALRRSEAWRRHWLLDAVLALRITLLPSEER